ncbi:glycerol-3-phosphate dehydrogenase/oxidase [Allorhodopirellula heiligendammensis]|uniref:Glycerol-3-phosphate dehydrogenase n=1 Tax=Allorhodopirellula heiligendammensis TaxID=2714739 RepID=A0A5C6C0W1_9BACT|nr:glycerol-3-phosphate dehydrogenase/oxidase [Allorhodopirellula heiligendammensis]TWU18190.1 Aerobic glycerol-3-phosphate dehydrogenase [Allorhodopirellula heiligendammensis]
MNREKFLNEVHDRREPFDIVVIGGGATGVGVALDAAVRGLSVLLLEQSDFGKGTSSRSTKLIHGGVRYLQQGNISLVRDSLHERSRLQANAPHLVHPLPFLVPCESLWQRFMMRTGFILYDLLAGKSKFPRAYGASSERAKQIASTIQPRRVRWGGVVYHDGQFDDARLLIHMAMTAVDHGACVLNAAKVTGLRHDDEGRVCGVTFEDQQNGLSRDVEARCVINATGPFCDAIRRSDDASAEPIIAPSQGVHIVLPREFLPDDTAIIVPKTSDGRVLFLIPWHGHVVVGTTDTPIEHATLEPTAQRDEIEFLLRTAGDYLTRVPSRDDCLSVFVGIRPLVRPPSRGSGTKGDTKSLSRDHTILVSKTGLITITGGKWTTVRHMGEDCVDRAVELVGLKTNGKSTVQLALHGASDAPSDCVYGTDEAFIEQLIAASPELGRQLHEDLPIRAAEVVWAVRREMALTVEDVLARRTRAMFLNIQAAKSIAPDVARLMSMELGHDQAWQDQQLADFQTTAAHFELAR